MTRIRRLDPDLLWEEQTPTGHLDSSVRGFLEPLLQDALRLNASSAKRSGWE